MIWSPLPLKLQENETDMVSLQTKGAGILIAQQNKDEFIAPEEKKNYH